MLDRTYAERAELAIDGEEYAVALLDRCKSGAAPQDDLASTVEFLGRGEMFRAFCRRIQKQCEASNA
jgi:hypothetical protein